MQHPLLQKFLQNNEPWLPRAFALAAAYLLARGLFLGVGGMFFLGLFCLASVLFGALLNAVYGRLPPCPPIELSGWTKWGISVTYLGKPGKTAAEYEINEKRMYRNVAYLFAVGFIVADIITALFGTLKISSETVLDAETALESFLHWLFILSSCFVLCSHSFRTCRSFRFWLSNEVYWVKCFYLFLFFVCFSAFLLLIIFSENEKGENAHHEFLFYLSMFLLATLMHYLSYYFMDRIGSRVSWARPFYMSLLFLVSVAMLFVIFMLEAPIAKVYAGMVFMLSSLVFVLCALYLVRGKK